MPGGGRRRPGEGSCGTWRCRDGVASIMQNVGLHLRRADLTRGASTVAGREVRRMRRVTAVAAALGVVLTGVSGTTAAQAAQDTSTRVTPGVAAAALSAAGAGT